MSSAHWQASAGLALFVVAMASSVMLAVDMVLDRAAAIAVGVATGLGFTVLWVVLPMRHRREDESEPSDDA